MQSNSGECVRNFHVSLEESYGEARRKLIEEFERAYLHHTLERAAMNLSAASRATGISRKHLRSLMHKHDISKTAAPEPTNPH